MSKNRTESSTENWGAALKYIAGRKSAEESLGFLAHISTTLQDTEDIYNVVPAVARACVPFFASAVSTDAPALHSDPIVHPAGEFETVLERIRGLAESCATPLVISDHEGLRHRVDPRHLELIHSWYAESAVIAPLRFRDGPGGYLVAVRGPGHRKGPVSPADNALITEVAARIAVFNAFAAGNSR